MKKTFVIIFGLMLGIMSVFGQHKTLDEVESVKAMITEIELQIDKIYTQKLINNMAIRFWTEAYEAGDCTESTMNDVVNTIKYRYGSNSVYALDVNTPSNTTLDNLLKRNTDWLNEYKAYLLKLTENY